MIKMFSPELSVKDQLQQLVILRIFYLLSEIFVVGISQTQFDSQLPWGLIWSVIGVHIALTTAYYWYSRVKVDIANHYLFQSILIDILLFSCLLYFSGGATNGAVSILLLPVATAAALFHWRLSLILAVVAIASYTTLMWNYWPVTVDPHAHHHQQQGFSFHLLAMWMTFIFSCLLLVWFIGLQSYAVRVKHKTLSSLRENQLRDEQLIAIATFAANAAHDLATPLSSISLLCDELKEDEGKEGIDTLIEQVQLCRTIVKSISHKAILNKSNIIQAQNTQAYFTELVQRWLVTRPDINLEFSQPGPWDEPFFIPDPGLESALTNILDNAADASVNNGANKLDLLLSITKNQKIVIKINDFGIGIDKELLPFLGKEPVHSKQNGMGLGQFLANSTIQRCGGNVWRQSGDNGTETVITLPMETSE